MKAIDLFAGIGGNTLGAQAAGIKVIWAANHNQRAVEHHRMNHPGVMHFTQDLQQADWAQVPKHDILLASPCCQGHTKARGRDRGPHHHKSRSTAWAVIGCAEYHRPELIFVENVMEFVAQWDLFPIWQMALERLGYSLNFNTIDAADLGVPQNRYRTYIMATRSRMPLDLEANGLDLYQEHIPVADIIDLNGGTWSPVNKPGRATATLERVARGRAQYGDTFIMPYYSNGSGKTGRSLTRPVGTVTTGDRWAIVKGDQMRMFTVDEYRKAMSFPEDIILPNNKREAVHFLGNATCPQAVTQLLSAGLSAMGVKAA